MRLIGLCVLLAVLLVAPASAKQTEVEYPTLAALEAAIVPLADPVELAQRLRGVREIPKPPEDAPVRKVGSRQLFWVINASENVEFQVQAVLRVVGEHIYLWLEEGAPVSDSDLQALADAFDTRIYDEVRALWGSEAMPGIDGDVRVHGLFAYGMGASTLAYFASRHVYPNEVYATSNEHEMFFFNLGATGVSNLDTPQMESTIAHEFQHMIRSNIQDNDALWLNEGFSTFTELALFGNYSFALHFLNSPDTQVNTWSEDGPRLPHYGAALLFVTYFYERYGLQGLQQLSENPGTNMDAFDATLRAMGEPGVNEFFADWVLANAIQDATLADGRYGYQLMSDLSPSQPIAIVADYPYSREGTLSQYAADTYTLTNLGGLSTISLSLSAPEAVRLIDTKAASGQWMWYSNRGDLSNPRLTRAFDLSGVEGATLNYRIWYDIEDLWDYGYVMVSADDGETWDILTAARMTGVNPQSLGFGTGYTGESGGWLEESIPLDTYAGQNILLRFEVINDEGISQPGMALDDISIPEIGYSSDFEADDGGWLAEGWLRTDNRLPQGVWVQVAQRDADQLEVSRQAAPLAGRWTVDLLPGAEQVVVVVSPYAPVTTVPMTYTLNVTGQ